MNREEQIGVCLVAIGVFGGNGLLTIVGLVLIFYKGDS